eukprot:2173516-Prorocentrum_lima.AAC.1
MTSSLVGSEMCIRDRLQSVRGGHERFRHQAEQELIAQALLNCERTEPVSYTHLTLPTICSV